VTVIAVGERGERGRRRYRFPIEVEDDGGAWYVGDEGGGIDERKIENWPAFCMTCSMVLRKLVIGWSRMSRPSFAEDGRLKK
jgi:hypothetical protein